MLTDQPYVARFVEQNIKQNAATARPRAPRPTGKSSSSRRGTTKPSSAAASGSVGGGVGGGGRPALVFQPLDWELDAPTRALAVPDAVVACDCIYNDALIPPLVQTCADACRLRSSDENDDAGGEGVPCVCVVAQQLRDPEIFEGWLKEFMRKGFRVWRVPDKELPEGLKSSSGFVVHVGILRESLERS